MFVFFGASATSLMSKSVVQAYSMAKFLAVLCLGPFLIFKLKQIINYKYTQDVLFLINAAFSISCPFK